MKIITLLLLLLTANAYSEDFIVFDLHKLLQGKIYIRNNTTISRYNATIKDLSSSANNSYQTRSGTAFGVLLDNINFENDNFNSGISFGLYDPATDTDYHYCPFNSDTNSNTLSTDLIDKSKDRTLENYFDDFNQTLPTIPGHYQLYYGKSIETSSCNQIVKNISTVNSTKANWIKNIAMIKDSSNSPYIISIAPPSCAENVASGILWPETDIILNADGTISDRTITANSQDNCTNTIYKHQGVTTRTCQYDETNFTSSWGPVNGPGCSKWCAAGNNYENNKDFTSGLKSISIPELKEGDERIYNAGSTELCYGNDPNILLTKQTTVKCEDIYGGEHPAITRIWQTNEAGATPFQILSNGNLSFVDSFSNGTINSSNTQSNAFNQKHQCRISANGHLGEDLFRHGYSKLYSDSYRGGDPYSDPRNIQYGKHRYQIYYMADNPLNITLNPDNEDIKPNNGDIIDVWRDQSIYNRHLNLQGKNIQWESNNSGRMRFDRKLATIDLPHYASNESLNNQISSLGFNMMTAFVLNNRYAHVGGTFVGKNGTACAIDFNKYIDDGYSGGRYYVRTNYADWAKSFNILHYGNNLSEIRIASKPCSYNSTTHSNALVFHIRGPRFPFTWDTFFGDDIGDSINNPGSNNQGKEWFVANYQNWVTPATKLPYDQVTFVSLRDATKQWAYNHRHTDNDRRYYGDRGSYDAGYNHQWVDFFDNFVSPAFYAINHTDSHFRTENVPLNPHYFNRQDLIVTDSNSPNLDSYNSPMNKARVFNVHGDCYNDTTGNGCSHNYAYNNFKTKPNGSLIIGSEEMDLSFHSIAMITQKQNSPDFVGVTATCNQCTYDPDSPENYNTCINFYCLNRPYSPSIHGYYSHNKLSYTKHGAFTYREVKLFNENNNWIQPMSFKDHYLNNDNRIYKNYLEAEMLSDMYNMYNIRKHWASTFSYSDPYAQANYNPNNNPIPASCVQRYDGNNNSDYHPCWFNKEFIRRGVGIYIPREWERSDWYYRP